MGFERLSPALRYQIVNGLGWSSLRPVQEQTIDAVLDGANCVVLAPTAGGKTEAALFPVLSMMDEAGWGAVGALYVAPIRALLNNQEARLEALTGLVGRRAFKWHGDVGASARRRFIEDPADVLATTPESLEAMFASARVPLRRLFAGLRVVIIDEVHAFAGDDRGAHLVALLERLTRVAGRDVQRIGLSATVGNPEAIVRWLGGSSQRAGVVVDPGGGRAVAELSLDYVGGIENAAIVIERLHRGRKRLVFTDSRRQVEMLGEALRRRGVDAWVTHSSLAASERRMAEEAFQSGTSCVIVATSALELGIDVGDLDHVLQVDAPATVSSFLQRMGRTGRRPGAQTNCTFLAQKDEGLLKAAGILRLHAEGFVEPVVASGRAAHILAHQVLAMALGQGGVPTTSWWAWVDGAACFSGLTAEDRQAVVEHMLSQDILAEVGGRLIIGDEGRKRYGGRHFMELYAVFSTPAMLRVMHGLREVGTVDASFLLQRDTEDLAFVLAGTAWRVTTIDWRRGACYVVPAPDGHFPRWFGRPQLLGRELCDAIRRELVSDKFAPWYSRRAREAMAGARAAHAFLRDQRAPVVEEPAVIRWWTFAGGRANNLLARLLSRRMGVDVGADNFAVSFRGEAAASGVAVRQALRALRDEATWTEEELEDLAPTSALGRLSKLEVCLPPHLERRLLADVLLDRAGAQEALSYLEAVPT